MVDYDQISREQIAAEELARTENAIADRATQLRLRDEREQQLADLRAKHGLPDHATPRQIADCEIAYDHAWRSHVANRFAGSARTSPRHCIADLHRGVRPQGDGAPARP